MKSTGKLLLFIFTFSALTASIHVAELIRQGD